MNKSALNLCGGKIFPLPNSFSMTPEDSLFVLHLDRMYGEISSSFRDAFTNHRSFTMTKFENPTTLDMFLDEDAFNFMETYPEQFDHITIYRFMEHVSLKDMFYAIYLLSTTVKIGGFIDVIVPDARKLALMLVEEGNNITQANDIILTTELLNEPSCPHASLWTKQRAKYYFELEGRFRVFGIEENFEFDGRDIYLRFFAERIK